MVTIRFDKNVAKESVGKNVGMCKINVLSLYDRNDNEKDPDEVAKPNLLYGSYIYAQKSSHSIYSEEFFYNMAVNYLI